MSHESFSNFIHAAEHSHALRKSLRECNNYNEIMHLAKRYGFLISPDDIKQVDVNEKMGSWFEKSRINPIRKV